MGVGKWFGKQARLPAQQHTLRSLGGDGLVAERVLACVGRQHGLPWNAYVGQLGGKVALTALVR